MSEKTENETAVIKGLKGVQAADSTICLVNGQEGRLLYRGYNIDDLAKNCSFAEVAYLLLKGELPNESQFDQFRAALVEHRRLPTSVVDFLRNQPRQAHPMALLRTAISIAGLHDPLAEDDSSEANYQKSIHLTAMTATIVAAIHRIQQGLDPIEPRSDIDHASNFMQFLFLSFC